MRAVVGFGLSLAFAGHAFAAQQVIVTLPTPVVVQPLPAGVKARPVSLTRFAANIPAGTIWANEQSSPYFMVPCVGGGEFVAWREASNKIENFDSFERTFRDELKANGFSVGGDPTNLFETQTGSDLQVGVLITDLRLKSCRFISPVNTSFAGAATMDIEWQVYSVSQGKIVARISTHGGAETKTTRVDEGAPRALASAFADNVRRLAANEEFRTLVTTSAAPTPSPMPTRLSFNAAATPTPMNAAVKSVVTIYAGDGSGSGVVISSDGYVLTNHHVAGSAGQVRIHWADGTDSIGDVVRSDARRDVALIRTTAKAAPLAIRHAPAQLGETVFAIGTPLQKEFANTLTRGVVSGTRLMDGLPLIQSDVAIDHGNSGGPLVDEQGRIIALAVSRYEADGVGHSINFFIPIDDALKALNLTPLETAASATAQK